MERKLKKVKLKFYQTFGIPKMEYKGCDCDTWCPYPMKQCGDTCPYWATYKVDYPEITDRILIQLICIYNSHIPCGLCNVDYDSLFCEVLDELTQEQNFREGNDDYSDCLLRDVQQLFKESV